MKKYVVAITIALTHFAACQKPNTSPRNTDTARTATDSIVVKGDTLTYEVITTDTSGWFGIWNEPDGTPNCNSLDSIYYGSPLYYQSGWRHTFICGDHPLQAFISVATRLYDHEITVNLYRNGKLIKKSTNDSGPGLGVAKLLLTVQADTMTGTAAMPVLTYEVLVDEQDTTKFESDGWTGQWTMPDGTVTILNKRLLSDFAICSGYKLTFKPLQLPFTMYLGGSPYSPDGARITINFYVNGLLVKTQSSRKPIYENTYVVQ